MPNVLRYVRPWLPPLRVGGKDIQLSAGAPKYQAFFYQSIYSSSHLCIHTSSFFSHLFSPFTYPFLALSERQPSIMVKGMGVGIRQSGSES